MALMSDVDQKEYEYLRYIISHVSWVKEAYRRLIVPLKDMDLDIAGLDQAIVDAGELVEEHDRSKFSKEEFQAYRKWHYPTDEEKNSTAYETTIKGAFDVAWEHHHDVNCHHPEHWVKLGDKQDMPLCYILEMLCDWSAVSRHFDTAVIDWYDNEAQDEKDCFTDKTARIVDKLVDILYRDPGIKY